MSVNAQALETHLSTRSYIEGYTPSQADVAVFKSLSEKPTGPHSSRWYKHISSYANEFDSLAGDKSKAAASYIASSSSAAAAGSDDSDDSDDNFDSDSDEDEEASKAKKAKQAAVLAAYREKKAKKTGPAAKSAVTMEVKPIDDETNMADVEKAVRSIEMDGLKWGASELVAVGYGIKKLVISMIVEDDKVSTVDLEDRIMEENEDMVQSVDVTAMQKL